MSSFAVLLSAEYEEVLTEDFRRGPGHDQVNSVQTRGIVKTSGFTRGVCKNRRFYRIYRLSGGILREQALLRKTKSPENRQKGGLF